MSVNAAAVTVQSPPAALRSAFSAAVLHAETSQFGDDGLVDFVASGGASGDDRGVGESRIRQRLEACRQGMLQLDALRSKHQKLMQEMRLLLRVPADEMEVVKTRVKHPSPVYNASITTELKLDDASRCDSPLSSSASHRSSVSMDSGCVSLSSDPLSSTHSPMSYSAYRKLSMEERFKQVMNNNGNCSNEMIRHQEVQPQEENDKETAQQNIDTAKARNGDSAIVATAIESTTALRCHGPGRYARNWQRPKSMYATGGGGGSAEANETGDDFVVDHHSFAQITPPPVHRQFSTMPGSASRVRNRVASASDLIAATARPAAPATSLTPSSEYAPLRFAVNQSPSMTPKSLSFAPPQQQSSSLPQQQRQSPLRQRHNAAAQRLPQNAASPRVPIFHASCVYVDRRSPPSRNVRPKSMMNLENHNDGDEVLKAQPARILSREQSYAHSSDSSPAESRKFHVIKASPSSTNINLFANNVATAMHNCLDRTESTRSGESVLTLSSTAFSCDKLPPRRRAIAKVWHESEGL